MCGTALGGGLVEADALQHHESTQPNAVNVYDATTWQELGSFELHEAFIRGMAVSPDGTRLVTAGEDGYVKVWDVTGIANGDRPTLLDRIPTPVASDAVFVGDDRILIFLREGARVMEASLSTDSVVATAKARLLREFTELECDTYFPDDPCPTLDELKNG